MKNKINDYIFLNKSEENQVGEIHIEGDIVDSQWWDDEVSPKNVAEGLKNLGKINSLDIYINSYGGSCVAGNTIVNIIDEFKKKNNCKANVYIRGIAASMGSGIAMVGDKVYMADNALFMVHKPITAVYGNSNDLQKQIEILDKTEYTLTKNYMRKFNGTEDELKQLLADETWFTADEALERGFVDEVTESVKIAASAKGLEVDNNLFNNKIVDLIKEKYPKAKISKKEEKELNYDEALKDFGISEEYFTTLNLESEKVLEVVNLVKDALKPEPIAPFIGKEEALKELGCEDITAKELINYAKAGMNPVKPNEELEDKAKAYDKIVDEAKKEALKDAIRAEGDFYDEKRTKKMLDAFNYDEIIAQDKVWKEKAEIALNAGKRKSSPENVIEKKEFINRKDLITD